MQIKKGDIDFVDKILSGCYDYYRQKDAMLLSLMHQYEERGFLTKAQLQGLFYKAEKVPDLPAGLLATLQSTIKKLPSKIKKAEQTIIKTENKKDKETENMLAKILAAFPQHKAVIGLQNNFKKHDKLTPTEKLELTKIYKLMVEKGKL
jgi:hypothetical protein